MEKRKKKCFSNRHTNTLSVTEREIREFLVENKEKKKEEQKETLDITNRFIMCFSFLFKNIFPSSSFRFRRTKIYKA